MKLNAEIWDVIILIGAVQGFVLSTLLLFSRKQPNIPANRWLAGLVFVLSLAGFGLSIHYTGLAASSLFPFLLQMGIGPFFYLYVRGLLKPEREFQRKDLLHFLPVFIDLRYLLVHYLFVGGWISRPVGEAIWTISTKYTDAVSWLAFVSYFAVSYRMVRQFRPADSEAAMLRLRWLKKFMVAFAVLIGIWAFYIGVEFSSLDWSYWEDYIIYVPLAVLIYWLGIAGYMQSPVADLGTLPPPLKTTAAIPLFSAIEMTAYAQRLKHAMETGKLYLNPALNVALLAEHANLPTKTVSYVLNQHVQTNFSDFVNAYRVEEVKKRLLETRHQHLTLAGIALEAGFNSQATFQRTFKQFTQLSPTQYLAQHSVKK